MIEIRIKPEQLELAKKKAKELGILKHSFMRGERNVVGFLGEILVADYLKADISNTYDYDILKSGIKIDVKSKRCTSKPLLHYDCSVAAYNTKQKCDFYVFVRILDNFQLGWILGIIRKENFFKKSSLIKAGYVDESNNMQFKVDTYNLSINNLLCFETLIKKKREQTVQL